MASTSEPVAVAKNSPISMRVMVTSQADGLLYHQTGLEIEEHYTDTGGATDHVFGLCHLFGFRFAPRIRDLKDRRLYLFPGQKPQPILDPLVGGFADVHYITAHWNDVLRLATSIRSGTVTASAILQKLSAYPRQNGLAVALRETGRIERTLFTLDWLKNIDLRRRANAGLNKGEARNALARAIFFYRFGEMRDRSFESQVAPKTIKACVAHLQNAADIARFGPVEE
jgi:TnpA family transposase